MTIAFHESVLAGIPQVTLYRMLWLRVQVFVVEQQAAYPELDGRDLEAGSRHLWAEEGDLVLATLRILDEGDVWRIGRVATAAAARGRGIAAELMTRAIAICDDTRPRPIVLDAQEHLALWYGRFGFDVDGDGFIEDGIPHVPMRRQTARADTRHLPPP